MKLLKRDRKVLLSILVSLKRGQEYLLLDSTLVCRRRSVATTTLDLINQQGTVCTEVNKHIGSELALLHTGIEQLERALNDT
jgi:hypothetical protein